MSNFSRRSFLGGMGAVGGAALAGGLAGCGGNVNISDNPSELVLWYWNRSISPTLLGEARDEIPGTSMHLRSDVIGGDYDSKIRTSLAGDAYIPDIAGVNANCALYFPTEDLFYDLNDFGAEDYRELYYDWKWDRGVTPTGRMCFWPMDTGPTGFYYRADIFEAAGLPSEPDDVEAATREWDDWIALGEELRASQDSALINTGGAVFNQFINASPERYFDEEDRPLFDREGSAVREAWDLAVRAIDAGVTARLPVDADQNSAWVSGRTAGNIEAVWWAEILKDTAPDTAGEWRLAAQPVRPGSSGGSFLAVPSTCKDPEAAFAFIHWLTSPENQAQTYNEIQLFPSCPSSFEDHDINSEVGFFGEQDPLEFFAAQAENVAPAFESTYENQIGFFTQELGNVESGKDSERAWFDAVEQIDRVLRKRGVIQ